jgi:glycerophosphoryl diester phosphodiesterase
VVKIIGHRGAKGLAPENTSASLKKALQHNVDAIEVDVRVTKDDVPILHHDDYIRGPSGQRLEVNRQTLSLLRNYLPELATLEGAIRIIDHAVPLQIEIKPGVNVQPIIAVIEQLLDNGWSKDEFRFTSFEGRILHAFHNAFPDCTLVVLETWSSVRATSRARSLGTRFITMNQRWLWRPFIRGMTRRGYIMGAYSVNSLRQAQLWEKAGLDNIITDYPDRFETKSK